MTNDVNVPARIDDADLDAAEGGIIAVLIGYRDEPAEPTRASGNAQPTGVEHVMTHELGHTF